MRQSFRPAVRGFTLIELMVAVVIVGILAAVAYPAYTAMTLRSRRADAVSLLTAVVQVQERYRTNHSSYAATAVALGVNVSGITKYYDLSIDGLGDPPALTTGYVATATAKSTAAQKNDLDCQKIVVQLEGADLKYLAYNSSNAQTGSTCWAR